jgi:tripeptide aminopeptidase
MVVADIKPKVLNLYKQFAAVPSTSGNEQEVRTIILNILKDLNIESRVDEYGNVTASLAGTGKPLILNAHMDRVKPGLGFSPVVEGDIVRSDGVTNSGADDILGIVAILIALEKMNATSSHRPLHAIFTVEEEVGAIHGAKLVDIESLGTDEAIVIDNAFPEAGTMVSKGSNLVWAVTTIAGKSGHSGKDLRQVVNALVPILESGIKPGIYNNDETRLNIGQITIAPGVGNATPGEVKMLTEFRSFLPEGELIKFIDSTFARMNQQVKDIGATIETELNVYCKSYIVQTDEPLVEAYSDVLQKRGAPLESKPTFVGSDANSFRARGVKAIVLSTGACNEHTLDEYFDLNSISQLIIDLVNLLGSHQGRNF